MRQSIEKNVRACNFSDMFFPLWAELILLLYKITDSALPIIILVEIIFLFPFFFVILNVVDIIIIWLERFA